MEERDTEKKETFFSVFSLPDGKTPVKDLTLPDAYWCGIEGTMNTTIFFHGFVKPDMPWHKGISAYNGLTGTLLWKRDDCRYLFNTETDLYAFREGFDGKEFLKLNPDTGEDIADSSLSADEVIPLQMKAREDADYSEYLFPAQISRDEFAFIAPLLKGVQPTGPFETIRYKNMLLACYHTAGENDTYNVHFLAADTNKKKVTDTELLAKGVTGYATDMFFIWKDYLFLLKQKKEVTVYSVTG